MWPLQKHLGADMYTVRWNSVEDKNVAAFRCVIYCRMNSQKATIVFIADENQRECVHVEKVRQLFIWGQICFLIEALLSGSSLQLSGRIIYTCAKYWLMLSFLFFHLVVQ